MSLAILFSLVGLRRATRPHRRRGRGRVGGGVVAREGGVGELWPEGKGMKDREGERGRERKVFGSQRNMWNKIQSKVKQVVKVDHWFDHLFNPWVTNSRAAPVPPTCCLNSPSHGRPTQPILPPSPPLQLQPAAHPIMCDPTSGPSQVEAIAHVVDGLPSSAVGGRCVSVCVGGGGVKGGSG